LLPKYTPVNRTLARWATATAIVVFLLIAAGAIVRTTGAGMGCPDWPKCFGLWVPPTKAGQLPIDYMHRYSTTHVRVEPFNAIKTWTEYLNRLLGALTGIMATITLLYSIKSYRNGSDKPVMWFALAALLLIGFEAWLGKRVVDTNLNQAKVTTHLLVGILIAAIYVVMALRARRLHLQLAFGGQVAKSLQILLPATIVVLAIQIGWGAQVRSHIDAGLLRYGEDQIDKWRSFVGSSLNGHRIFAFAVLIGVSANWFFARKYLMRTIFYSAIAIALACTLLQVLSGLLLTWVGMFAPLRVLHVLLGSITLTATLGAWYLFLQRRRINEYLS